MTESSVKDGDEQRRQEESRMSPDPPQNFTTKSKDIVDDEIPISPQDLLYRRCLYM